MSWADLIEKANAAAGAGKPRRKRPDGEEHRIQCACVRWFRLQYPRLAKRLIAVGNGGKRNAVTGAMLKAEGVLAGVSDLVLFAKRGRYGALLIEMKTASRSSRQEESQKAWEADLTASGEYRYVVCRSVEGFISEVNAYLALGNEDAPVPII